MQNIIVTRVTIVNMYMKINHGKRRIFFIGLKNFFLIIITGFIKVLTVPLLVAELVFHIKATVQNTG